MPKKITITFKNPVDETNVDHLEVWWKLGVGGTYAQLGSDIPFVSGTADYLVEDLDVNDGDIIYYQARAYNASGDYSVIEDYIQVSGGSIDIYEPDWINRFTIQPQDANGYTIFTPSIDSKIVYLDPTGGDDATAISYAHDSFADLFQPTGELAYATFSTAYNELRNGQADWLLIKKGEEFLDIAVTIQISGKNTNERMLIGAYGVGARPLFKVSNSQTSTTFRFWRGSEFFNVVGLDIYGYQNDPSTVDYLPTSNMNPAISGYCYDPVDGLNRHILIEDCRMRYLSGGVLMTVVGAAEKETDTFDFQLRKNIIHNCLSNLAVYSHSSGVALNYMDALIEGNILYHNGWGMRDTSGTEVLSTALTGVVTSISVDLIPGDSPPSGYINVTTDAAATVQVKYTSFTGNTYTVESTDFSADNASVGNAARNVIPRASIYNHNMYNSGMKNTICRNNISIAPSSIHYKWTSNMTLDDNNAQLAVALTGANETQVSVKNNVSLQTPQTGDILITLDNASTITIAYTAFSNNVYTIPATDFSVNTASVDNSAINQSLVNVVKSDGVSMYDNLFVDGEVITSFGGNQTLDNGFRFSRYRYQNNVAQYIGKNQNTNRTLAYGVETNDVDDVLIEKNLFLKTDNPLINLGFNTQYSGYANNVISRHNKSYETNMDSFANGEGTNKTNNGIYENSTDLAVGAYIDPTRTIETFMASIGEIATMDEFISQLLTISKDSQKPALTITDILEYHRAGYAYSAPIYEIADLPATLSVDDGEEVSLTYSVVSDEAITYKWYIDGIEEVGQTSAVFTKTMPTFGTYAIYCVATAGQSSLTSGITTLTVNEVVVRNYLDLKAASGSYIFAPSGGLSAGDTLYCKFNIPSSAPDFIALFGNSVDTGQYITIFQGTTVTVRMGTSLVFTVPNLRDDTDHTMSFTRDASGVPTLTVDGVDYSENTSTTSTNIHYINWINNSASGTYNPIDMRVWDIGYIKGGLTTEWAIDSGSTTTESPTLDEAGRGDITFNNVVSGDWI